MEQYQIQSYEKRALYTFKHTIQVHVHIYTTKYNTGYIHTLIGVHASYMYVVEPLYADPFRTVLNCPELIIKLSFSVV